MFVIIDWTYCETILSFRITKELPRYKEELEILKFICTDFWSCVYKKQVDNLRTNHQGVYVLHDNDFRFFSKLSNGTQYLKSAPKVSKYNLRPYILILMLKFWLLIFSVCYVHVWSHSRSFRKFWNFKYCYRWNS